MPNPQISLSLSRREEASFALGISRCPSVTQRSPWIRSAPLAARVVAERQQNAPVSPAKSLRVCPRFDTNEHRSCAALRDAPSSCSLCAPRIFKCPLAPLMKSFGVVACEAHGFFGCMSISALVLPKALRANSTIGYPAEDTPPTSRSEAIAMVAPLEAVLGAPVGVDSFVRC